jgi:hypothetical protein
MAPNEPYGLRTVPNLLKWKYVDMQSVDFKAVRDPRNDSFEMFAGAQNGTEVSCFKIAFQPEDLDKIKHDWERLQIHGNSAIMECTFLAKQGQWKYHTLRPDKMQPNYIRVVFDTLLVIAEGVSDKELQNFFKQVPPKHLSGQNPHPTGSHSHNNLPPRAPSPQQRPNPDTK